LGRCSSSKSLLAHIHFCADPPPPHARLEFDLSNGPRVLCYSSVRARGKFASGVVQTWEESCGDDGGDRRRYLNVINRMVCPLAAEPSSLHLSWLVRLETGPGPTEMLLQRPWPAQQRVRAAPCSAEPVGQKIQGTAAGDVPIFAAVPPSSWTRSRVPLPPSDSPNLKLIF